MKHRAPAVCLPVVLLGLAGSSGVSHAANQPPVARFTLTPASGTVEKTFVVDASTSTDDKTIPSRLRVRWDWENDGNWDTSYTTVKTASHRYVGEGNRTIRLEVIDQNNATGTTTQPVAVVPPAATQRFVGGGDAREPDVDVNPTDSGNIVVSVATGGQGGTNIPEPAYASIDGGVSWVRGAGHEHNVGLDPGFEFLPNGTAVLMSLDDTVCDGDPQGVQIDLSGDKGLNYMRAGYAFDENTLFLLPNGASRAVCGQRFTYPCTSGWDLLLYDYPKIAVDKGATSPFAGNLYVMAHNVGFDQDGNGTCDSTYVVFARSTNSGTSWISAQALPARKLSSALGIGADGVIYYANVTGDAACSSVNGIRLNRSTNGGASFGASSCAYEATGDLTPTRTWPAADPSNASRVYILFEAEATSLAGSVHVYIIRSTDGGATWSSPVRVDDVLPGDQVDHTRSTLSVSSNGRLDAAWFDYRNSSPTRLQGNGQVGDVYYAFSEDGGITWSRNVRLTPAAAPAYWGSRNDFMTIVSKGDKAYAAYSVSPSAPYAYEAYLATIQF